MSKIFLSIILLVSASCSTPSKMFDNKYKYKSVLEKNTKQDKQYSGMNNLYQVSVTHLNQDVMSLKNQKLAFLQQWPSHKVEEASQKQEDSLSKTTQFIIVLYTPNTKLNDLSKGENSVWRTYLQVDNQRYQGIATKVEENSLQLKSLIPNTNRFSKVYKLDFPITSSESDLSQNLKFILTSDLGTTELKFR